jgi:SAM-dependent methyltransferase
MSSTPSLSAETAGDASEAAEFDRYAEEYDAALEQGISVSGEDKHYFARGRVTWLAQQLASQNFTPRTVLDFGCGTGTATPYLLECPGVEKVIGVDISPKSIAVARRTFGSDRAEFFTLPDFTPNGKIDVAYCNGVFHHIPPAERPEALSYVLRSLRPGGYFALWENNPWNPATRYVMRRCPFDADAITLTPPEARQLVHRHGFQVSSTHYLFIFPRTLSFLRWMEPRVARLPLGTQYQILCRKS